MKHTASIHDLMFHNLYPTVQQIAKRTESLLQSRQRRGIKFTRSEAIQLAEKQLISERIATREHNHRKATHTARLAFRAANAIPAR
jgi:hypothetical protein